MSARYRIFETALGPAAIVASERGLRRVYLPENKAEALRRRVLGDVPDAVADDGLLPGLVDRLQRYCQGEDVRFDDPLDLEGTPAFHRRVWQTLQRVRFGETLTYRELAERAGRPGAARAVGTAMSHNPLPIVVPCHRVVRSDGGLGGFSAPRGLPLKRALLALEKAEGFCSSAGKA